MKNLSVISAQHIEGYKIRITYSDGSQNIIDFHDVINNLRVPEYRSYLQMDKFLTFKIEMDNIVWGDDWDLIFPVEQLHNGKILI